MSIGWMFNVGADSTVRPNNDLNSLWYKTKYCVFSTKGCKCGFACLKFWN